MKKLFFIFALLAVAMSASTASAATYETLYVTGSLNGKNWDSNGSITLTNPSDGWFKLDVTSVAEFKVSSTKGDWDAFNSGCVRFQLSGKNINATYDGKANDSGNSSIPSSTKFVYFSVDLTKCAVSDGTWTPEKYEIPEDIIGDDPYTVKVDVSKTGWESVKIHYWDGDATPTTWWGIDMTDEGNNIWSYTFKDGKTPKFVIFNNGENSQTENLDFVAGKTYVLRSKNDKSQWTEIPGEETEPENPAETVTYEVWLRTKWTEVYAKVWDAANDNKSYTGTGTYGQGISMDPSHHNDFLLRFTCSATAPQLKIKFSNGDADYLLESETFDVINHHIYTSIQGDLGDVDEFTGEVENPDPTIPSNQYWLYPVRPKQDEKATLYFNRSKNNSLKNTDVIYTWLGLTNESGSGDWMCSPSCDWGNVKGTKYEMTRVDNSDIYKLEFDPTIEDWFGLDITERPKYMAVIFRNENGSTNTGNLYIPLGKMPAPKPTSKIGAYVSHDVADGKLTITATKGTLVLTPYSPEIIKVFTLMNDATKTAERRSISVIDPEKDADYCFYDIPEADINVVTDSEDQLEVNFLPANGEGNTVTVLVDKENCLLHFYQNGKLLLSEFGGLYNSPNGGNSSVSFQGMGDAGFYGGGYNGNRMNWDGTSMIMRNTQTGNWAQGSSHPHNINIPYYVSTSGYGVYVDDHYINATLTPSADGTVYSSESEDPIAYYFVGGGTMERAMQNYTMLTGRQKLPAYWALGYISSKYSFASEKEANDNISATKTMGLPLDAIVFDIHWQGGPYMMGKLDWDTGNYGSGTGIYNKYLNQNIHTINISEPYFTNGSGNYDYPNSKGYFAHSQCSDMNWLGSGPIGLIDASNEAAMDWFYGLYKKHTEAGLGAWWYDLGEPEQHTWGSTHQGGSMNQIRNEFGNLWTGGIHRRTQRDFPAMRHITMPRAGTAGMQRYGAMPWTGDIARSWSGLAAQVPATVSASMSGVGYLGSDIGGFIANGTDAKMYLRWVQLGILYPSMRTHSANTPEPWQNAYSTYRNEIVKAVRQRYAYLPYTYTLSFQNTYLGSPTSRPANFHDSDPSRLNNVIDAYYWGRDLYVAPMLENKASRTIRLPEGDWLDMNTFKLYQGKQDIEYKVANDVLPHFMRRGSFITQYAAADNCTSTADLDRSKLLIDYVIPTDPHVMYSQYYEDDHTTPDPVNSDAKNYVLTTMHGIIQGPNLLINFDREGNGFEGMPETQSVVMRVHSYAIDGENAPVTLKEHPNPAQRQTLDTESSTTNLTKVDSYDDVANATTNCYAVVKGSAEDGSDSKTYVHINLDPLKSYSLQMGSTTPTGVDDISTDRNFALDLSAGDGYINYTASEGLTNVAIEIFTTTGTLVSRFDNLVANGYVQQVYPSLSTGMYIVRLTAHDNTDNHLTRTIKYIAY